MTLRHSASGIVSSTDSTFEASGRPGLVKKILEHWDVGRRIYAISPRTRDSMEPAYEAHQAILAALDKGDARAAERHTRIHTEQAAERILTGLREQRRRGVVAGGDEDRSTSRRFPDTAASRRVLTGSPVLHPHTES